MLVECEPPHFKPPVSFLCISPYPPTSIIAIIIITSSCWRPKSEKKSCAGQPAYCCCRRKARDRRNSRRLHGTGIGTGGKVICTGAQQRHQPASQSVCQSVSQVLKPASDPTTQRSPRPPHLRFRPLRYKRILSARSGSDHPRPSRHLPWSCPVLSCPAITTTTPPPSFLSSPPASQRAGGPIPSGPPNPRRRGCSHTTHSLSSSAPCRGHSSWRWRWRTTTKWRVPSREFPPPYSRHPIFFLFTFY